MTYAKFRSFSNSEINDAIARFSENGKTFKINAQTVRKIGEQLLELRESTLSEVELVNICVGQALRPIDKVTSRRGKAEPHPQVLDGYLTVVRDILRHRSTSGSGNSDAGRCIRPTLQRSAAATASTA